jgi:P27 family predicted phage terminase small subunit
MKPVCAPEGLAPSTASWFRSVCKDYVLEPHHVRLLTMACRAWDRSEQARQMLDDEGLTTRDRYGTAKAHPAVAIERDCRTQFARLVRELDLDVEAPRSERVGPPGLKSNRR